MRAEVNLMAAHEVAGLFRHGMEGDAMSRSMLDDDATIASFPKMIDTLAGNSVSIGRVCFPSSPLSAPFVSRFPRVLPLSLFLSLYRFSSHFLTFSLFSR